jgi:hypothetical protein
MDESNDAIECAEQGGGEVGVCRHPADTEQQRPAGIVERGLVHLPAVVRKRQGVFLLDKPDVLFMRLGVETHVRPEEGLIVEKQNGPGDEHERQEAIEPLVGREGPATRSRLLTPPAKPFHKPNHDQ